MLREGHDEYEGTVAVIPQLSKPSKPRASNASVVVLAGYSLEEACIQSR